tara:strand:+ start:734 stop:1555 length:822 start_codon:yes stop_codon:yes gene_type:complete
MNKLEQYTVREISFKLHGKEPAITATDSSVVETLEYLKNLINQPTDCPKLKAYRNDSSNKEWYEGQRKARLDEYMSKVRKAETHINFENSEFLEQELFVIKENESETYINRNDFIDLLKIDPDLKELYSLNPFWEETTKSKIKESAEAKAENKKEISSTAKSKQKARQDPLYKEIESVKKRMENKIGTTLKYVLNKILSYGYKNKFIEYKETNPKMISITLPDDFLGDVIAAKAIASDNYNEETFYTELDVANKKHHVSFKKKDGKTIITITI